MKVNRPKGTNDFFGNEIIRFREIESKFRKAMINFGASEILTPIFEETSVFIRSVGETSDIVNKEMYTFLDRGDRSMTLRPEGTAPIVRALVQNKLYVATGAKKFFYTGPNFRYEQPQSGRSRQFHQLGLEVFCSESAYLDADCIKVCTDFIQSLGIENVKLHLNSIGRAESRSEYVKALVAYFTPVIADFCPDCQNRLLKNPLRILDCKTDHNKEIVKNAPRLSDYLSEEDTNYYNKVREILDELKVEYVCHEELVRGLDYYSDEVFELVYSKSGSQYDGMVVGGGGRYNDLPKAFDGPDLPAIGFGLGIERLMLVMEDSLVPLPTEENSRIVIMTIGEKTKGFGLKLANYLRKDFQVEIDCHSHALKSQFKLGERFNAKYFIIIGEDEIEKQEVTVKFTETKEEIKVPIKHLLEHLR